MVGMKTFICTVSSILLFLTACNSSVESYKLMYEGYVKELSDSSRYFGRTDYKGGNVIAADFITQEIRKLGLDVMEQDFTYPKNTMHGALSFSVDGREYEFSKEFVVKEFSSSKNATMDIYKECITRGYTEAFVDAGAVVSTPTCGPCLGGYMGILAKGEKCVSTTNRNFVGRMGHVESEVYLASPLTAAMSAVRGYIADPKEVL